jgi:hypothetical protein
MKVPKFHKLTHLVGGELGQQNREFLDNINNLTELIGATNQVKKLCKQVLNETFDNMLGLNDQCQTSYLEDIMYAIDRQLPCHSVRTHTSRMESWLEYSIEQLSQSVGDEELKENAQSVHYMCTGLAVRAFIENTHINGVFIVSTFYKGVEDILLKCDSQFLHAFARTMIDSEIFLMRYELYNRYIFKGGKKLKPWIIWNDEKNSYYHSSDTSSYMMIRRALDHNGELEKPNIPPIKWLGSGTELLDLFASLAEKGYIDLPQPGEATRVSWERVCKAICGLFNIAGTRRQDSRTEDWVTLRQYFKETTRERKTNEYSYDRLKGRPRHFEAILPPKPRLKSPK